MEKEPLLKEQEEKIVFVKDNKLINNNVSKKKSHWDRAAIGTVILTFVVVYLLGRTTYGFYLGFKYFDLRYVEPVVLNDSNLEVAN